MYKAFFPQLIAGPIVRYRDISDKIVERVFSSRQFVEGIQRFIFGLGKKILIANNVAVVADEMFRIDGASVSPLFAWIGVMCYAMQIYFDFSGYSDMAIGLGKMFGFNFLENFNYPYISRSIKEFWRRWHMSLSGWFRDYLYIPLGGNRAGKVRNYFNLFIVFFLCGLWHGASWTFVIWGIWHGLFLVIERIGFGSIINKIPRVLQFTYTLVIVLIGWVFFRADSVTHASQILKSMFLISYGDQSVFPSLTPQVITAFIFGLVGSTPVIRVIGLKVKAAIEAEHRLRYAMVFVFALFIVSVFAISIISLSTTTYNPFIYFRF